MISTLQRPRGFVQVLISVFTQVNGKFDCGSAEHGPTPQGKPCMGSSSGRSWCTALARLCVVHIHIHTLKSDENNHNRKHKLVDGFNFGVLKKHSGLSSGMCATCLMYHTARRFLQSL